MQRRIDNCSRSALSVGAYPLYWRRCYRFHNNSRIQYKIGVP